MLPSQNAITLIKQFEGCFLSAYSDPVGILTIGYGHTGGVRPGQTITQAQADAFLVTDAAAAACIVARAVTAPLNQNQFDALTSFVFNVGPGAKGIKSGFVTLKEGGPSTMLRLLNQGNFLGAAAQFPAWCMGDGKVLPGLVARRAAERALFEKQA